MSKLAKPCTCTRVELRLPNALTEGSVLPTGAR